ncbi:hypothetical protein [Bradyrhizobium sp. SYSU BS000235]|uniref:hypothetical protein n=1 Tax=Bradyrhizobium sp. SYSU BS000235 TaxID=3411332 RepID=UPI003C774077
MAKEDLSFFLLFVVWWFAATVQLLVLWPSNHIGQFDLLLVIGLAIFPGTLFGIPVVTYFACAYLVSKLVSGDAGVAIFLGFAIAGCLMVAHFWGATAYIPTASVAIMVTLIRLIRFRDEAAGVW